MRYKLRVVVEDEYDMEEDANMFADEMTHEEAIDLLSYLEKAYDDLLAKRLMEKTNA
ncbi:MAG: hypothetical protein WC822_01080 [Candidatus Paceibacterota bacterium]